MLRCCYMYKFSSRYMYVWHIRTYCDIGIIGVSINEPQTLGLSAWGGLLLPPTGAQSRLGGFPTILSITQCQIDILFGIVCQYRPDDTILVRHWVFPSMGAETDYLPWRAPGTMERDSFHAKWQKPRTRRTNLSLGAHHAGGFQLLSIIHVAILPDKSINVYVVSTLPIKGPFG